MTYSLTIPGLAAQIVQPSDVLEFLQAARQDLSGTDYPGALQLGQALQRILVLEGFTPREVRTFSANYVLALEGYSDQAHECIYQISEALALVDFKKYWNN